MVEVMLEAIDPHRHTKAFWAAAAAAAALGAAVGEEAE
jgi:hypothetical protein